MRLTKLTQWSMVVVFLSLAVIFTSSCGDSAQYQITKQLVSSEGHSMLSKINESSHRIPENFMPIFCKMCEYMLLVVRDKNSLEKNALDLTPAKKKEINYWFLDTSFDGVSPSAKKDLENFRSKMLRFLNATDMDDYSKGYSQSELSQEFTPILIDFEVNGKVLSRIGRDDLAKPIDALLSMNKLIVMKSADVDTDKADEARPEVKYFVEYCAIYMSMIIKPAGRPILAQAALLISRPNDITDTQTQGEYTNLYYSLVALSRSITEQNPFEKKEQARTLVDLARVVKKYNITVNEVYNSGGGKTAEIVEYLQKLGETKK